MDHVLRKALVQIRDAPAYRDLITTWREMPAQPARYAPTPRNLAPEVLNVLHQTGVSGLYRHQAEAIALALEGQHLVVVTPTASGKTLCYNVPVLQQLLQNDQACALYLFPTKALAHDQLAALDQLLSLTELGSCAAAYDGDTPLGRRATIRRTARVIVTNPDMLHISMLPNHTLWERFWRNLSYVVIDELHSYRGVFGSHVANVLRRLRRICHFYGNRPQFICASATIANPQQLAQALVEEPVQVVQENGAPRGERIMAFCNPPILDQRLGLRRPLLDQVQELANDLLQRNFQTVVFVSSRRAVERLVILLRQQAHQVGRDPQTIRGYRGGYLANERRAIEQGLRQGDVRCVVATNALELGIDIGGLDVCIMAGYPGTIASTWQRAGRAGRGQRLAAALLVASDAPSDQYVIQHPEYFFERSPEHALVQPNNLYLLLDHLRCATAELPFQAQATFGDQDVTPLLGFLQEQGEVDQARGRWFWHGSATPAAGISLRSASAECVMIMAPQEAGPASILGSVDRERAPMWAHKGAIYMHEGAQYLIARLDWAAGIAQAQPVQVDYYTEASQNTRITIEQILEEQSSTSLALARGDIRLTQSVSRYRRIHLIQHTTLGWGTVDLPEQVSYNQACWFMVPEQVVTKLNTADCWTGQRSFTRGPSWPAQRNKARQRDGYTCRWCGAPEQPERQYEVHHIVPFGEFDWEPGRNHNDRLANALDNLITLCPACHRQAERQVAVQSTLAGLARVMGHVIPLLFMCDRHDVGIHTDVRCPETKLPTIFVYDAVAGGVGLSDQVMSAAREILERCGALVQSCGCEAGCPSCIGAANVPNPEARRQVVHLAQTLIADMQQSVPL